MNDPRGKTWYPIAYMFVVTALFSGILISLSAATAERVKRNERIFRERAAVIALGLAGDDVDDETANALYEDRVRVVKIDPAGGDADENILQYELLAAGGAGEPIGFGVPIYGQGYWDEIRGVLGVKADRKTIIGLTFYEQKETPGLGAEIASPAWREQFGAGKVLADGDPALDFRPAGAALDAGSVAAITGATQTCTRLERFMNRRIAAWREASGGEERP